MPDNEELRVELERAMAFVPGCPFKAEVGESGDLLGEGDRLVFAVDASTVPAGRATTAAR